MCLGTRNWQQDWTHTATPNNELGNFVPGTIVLSSAGLGGLTHKGDTLLPGVISNGKLWLPPETFVSLRSKDQQVRAIIYWRINGPDHQAEAELLFSTGAKKIMCGSQVVSWYLLVLAGTLLPTITMNGQVQQFQNEKVSKHSRMEVGVTLSRKPPRPSENIAKGTLPPYPSQTWPQLLSAGFPSKLYLKSIYSSHSTSIL